MTGDSESTSLPSVGISVCPVKQKGFAPCEEENKKRGKEKKI